MANVIVGTVSNGLTAAGSTQGTATVLTLEDNHVFTTVAAGTGAVFQSNQYAAGDGVRVSNYGANALLLYPASGGTISNGSANTPISIAAGAQANLFCVSGNDWSAINALGGGGGGTITLTSDVTGSGTSSIATTLKTNYKLVSITFVIDGGGSVITTGIKGDLEIPFDCTINRSTLLADQSGSIVVDIWKDTYANYPPTVADSITASAKPTISSATKAQDSTLTGWTTSITAGDTLRFNVDSITTCTRVTLALKATKT